MYKLDNLRCISSHHIASDRILSHFIASYHLSYHTISHVHRYDHIQSYSYNIIKLKNSHSQSLNPSNSKPCPQNRWPLQRPGKAPPWPCGSSTPWPASRRSSSKIGRLGVANGGIEWFSQWIYQWNMVMNISFKSWWLLVGLKHTIWINMGFRHGDCGNIPKIWWFQRINCMEIGFYPW